MAGRKNYKTLLIEARNLRSEAGKNAHKRATILCQVFDDRDFRADIGALDDFGAAEVLDAECEDLCVGFLELRAMLAAFPDATDWSDGKLATLYKRTQEKADAEAPEKPARTVNRVTRKEMEVETNARKDAEAMLRRVEKQQKDTESELAGVRAQLAAALSENERLKGRLEELERLLPRIKAA